MTLPRDQQQLVLGRYRLGAVLGRGGAALVHRAHDVRTGQEVAVKEIPVELDMARRAGAEVRAAGMLSHPGIVRLLDFGEDHAACYLVSELVEGPSLAEHLRSGGGGDAARIVTIIADVLDGLAHAHERGVTHRDVKPANILVDRAGRGRLTDFGIARIAGEAGLTAAGGLVGTVSYMAPEQARGEQTGPAADVYSACLVLYEALSGRNPIAGASPAETLRRAAGGRVPPLSQYRPDLPSSLCRAVDEGLTADPRSRPAPAWMARTLRAQIPAVRAGGRGRGRLGRRAPTALGATGAAGLAVLVLHEVTHLQPGAIALSAVVAGAAFAVAPWPAALAAWTGAMVVLGTAAPGLAMVLGALGLVALVPLRARGRLALIPAAAPALAAVGLAPVFAAIAGSVRGWRFRIWLALSGAASTLAWQVIAGADPGIDGGRITGVWERVQGVVSPIETVTRLGEPLQQRPAIAIAAGLVAVAALVFPALLRLRSGVPRAAGAAALVALMIVGAGATGGSIESAAGAFLPGGILVVAWAGSPWRRLRRAVDRHATVTLRGATVERLPAA